MTDQDPKNGMPPAYRTENEVYSPEDKVTTPSEGDVSPTSQSSSEPSQDLSDLREKIDPLKDFLQTKTTCSKCFQNKVRIQTGISPNRKRKYYKDGEGRKWVGKKCPDCVKAEHREYMRGYRKGKRSTEKASHKTSLDHLFNLD